MKFLQLRMLNWRSFAGEQEIKFSTDPERPVTLLFGPNGAGKTALLNAFTWALYGTFTDGFDRHESLVNLLRHCNANQPPSNMQHVSSQCCMEMFLVAAVLLFGTPHMHFPT